MKQTCLFASESESSLQRPQRWLGLAEETRQELAALLVQLVIAMHAPSDTEESGDGRNDE